eukprot:3001839-Prymnesium_polylepis.1
MGRPAVTCERLRAAAPPPPPTSAPSGSPSAPTAGADADWSALLAPVAQGAGEGGGGGACWVPVAARAEAIECSPREPPPQLGAWARLWAVLRRLLTVGLTAAE